MSKAWRSRSLRSCLEYEPRELKFGTSGRRGEVVHLTQLEIYINAFAELKYLQSLSPAEGGIVPGEQFYLAYDLRPSSNRYVDDQGGYGEIAQAIERAITDATMKSVNLGQIPTPALTYYALAHGKGSIMVTGSHIPFDRNGYKVNTSRGELLKKDEKPINELVLQVRIQIYDQAYSDSPFNARGLFKEGHQDLSRESDEARSFYIDRYVNFFHEQSLGEQDLLVYQHSAVGRDILTEIAGELGARIVTCGRSDRFVSIDTENIDDAQLGMIQALVDEATPKRGTPLAVISTDGDSDRPLVLGIDRATGRVSFFGGDLLGMIVAEYLQADAVVVPISCNDAIDRGDLRSKLEPKTRIGSPYVIEGMEKARIKGKHAICGWEANGGFLTGSNIERNGKVLTALPTRDAVLPILCTLFAAREKGLTLTELFARLPRRFSRAALLRQFPRALGLELVEGLSPMGRWIRDVTFDPAHTSLSDENGNVLPADEFTLAELQNIRQRLERFFTPEDGFDGIVGLNYTDGVRIRFGNGDVAHIRPSGNADELRIYAVADSQIRADKIARAAITEPDGILRRIEKMVRR